MRIKAGSLASRGLNRFSASAEGQTLWSWSRHQGRRKELRYLCTKLAFELESKFVDRQHCKLYLARLLSISALRLHRE